MVQAVNSGMDCGQQQYEGGLTGTMDIEMGMDVEHGVEVPSQVGSEARVAGLDPSNPQHAWNPAPRLLHQGTDISSSLIYRITLILIIDKHSLDQLSLLYLFYLLQCVGTGSTDSNRVSRSIWSKSVLIQVPVCLESFLFHRSTWPDYLLPHSCPTGSNQQ